MFTNIKDFAVIVCMFPPQLWVENQLLHVFQEPLVTGKSSVKGGKKDPIVDLRNIGSFEENFFLILLGKNSDHSSTIHMWRITMASSTVDNAQSDGMM